MIISLESLTVRVITDYALAAFRAANAAAEKMCGNAVLKNSVVARVAAQEN